MKKYIFFFIGLVIVSLFVSMKIWFHPWFHKEILHAAQNIKDVKIEWKSFQVQPWLLRANFYDTKVESSFTDRQFHPKKLTIQIALWTSFIRGKTIVNIEISNLNYETKINNQDPIDWKNTFQIIQKLPIHNFLIKELKWKASINKNSILSPATRLDVTNYFEEIRVITKSKVEFQKSNIDLNAYFLITKDKIRLIDLQADQKPSVLLMSGEWKNWPQTKDILLNVDAKWDASSIKPWVSLWKKDFPSVKGFWNVQAKVKRDKSFFDIKAQNVQFKNIFLSQLKSKGSIDSKGIYLELLHLEKEKGWTSFLEKAYFKWDSNFKFNHYSHIKDFENIETIFNWDTPLQFKSPFSGKCKGRIKKFKIRCSVDSKFQEFSIVDDNDVSILFRPFDFVGSFTISNGFSLKGNLSSHNSKMKIQGKHLKNNQWEAAFSGYFDTSNFQQMFGQKFKGKAHFKKGVLTINKDSFLASSSLKWDNLEWNGDKFGNLDTQIIYSPKKVEFKNIQAQRNQSKYNGNLAFLIPEEKVTANIKSDDIFLEDITQSLKKKFPFSLMGRGKLKLIMDSPLNVKKLNYKIDSQFDNIKIQNDFFEKLNLNIYSRDGRSVITQGILKKTKGSISLTGNFDISSKKINFEVDGKDLLLEKSQTIQNLALLSGQLNFQSQIKGSVNKPRGFINLQVDSARHQLVDIGNSKAQLKFKSHKFTGAAQLFDQQIKAQDIQFSLKNDSPISFKADLRNWNFISLWPSKVASNQIYSKVSGKADFSFLWNKPRWLTGILNLKKFHFQYGTHPLELKSPINLNFNKGKFSVENSEWIGNESTLSIKNLGNSQMRADGSLRLEFLNVFLPFIKNVTGDLNLNVQFNNDLNNWDPKGNFKVNHSALNITSYVDVLQSLKMNGSIKDRQIYIKKMTAQTPKGGDVEGSGMVGLFEKNQFPVDLKFKLKESFGIYINETIHGLGHGNLRIFGDKSPYVMEGNFVAESGYFKQELQSQKESLPDVSDEEPDVFVWDMKLSFPKPFAIENTLFTTFVDGFLNLKGKLSNPSTEGEIRFIPEGLLHLREYDFTLESGRLQYKSQPLLEPYFQFVGDTHFEEIKPGDNRAILYEITANISGKPNDIDFKVSSQPHLTEEEILSMMALGARSIGFTNPTQQMNQIATYSGYKIGSMLFQDTIGKELNKLLGVQIYITSYINNKKNAPSSKIELHKRWFKKLNTSYTQSIDEDYNSFKLEYNLFPDFSILGTWENDKEENQEDSSLGIELEYKSDF